MKTKKIIPFFTAAAIMLTACNAPKTEPLKTETAVLQPLKDTLSVNTAKRLVGNFDSRSAKLKKGGLLMPDTRCVWFNKEQLRSLLNKVDSIKDGDGIRFYFAAYDKNLTAGTQKIKPEYQDYATLVMVTTHKESINNNLYHYDYYTTPKKLVNGQSVNDVDHGGAIIMSAPENQGELCPPPAKCNTVGATLLP